ncbi:MAG: MFS transporter [Clostridia bacterium]|nr:MFS transporter [Clostridia bacterium]
MATAGKRRYRMIESRRDRILLTLTTAFAYFCSYMTRVNYKAVITEIVAAEGVPMDRAAVALTGLFVTYGVGQLISGWLGDRINPKYLMTGGLLLASIMNLLLPLSDDTVWMTAVWCVNGLGQAMMWPPIVKTLTNFMSSDDYLRASVKVCWGSNIATILLYLCAPLVIVLTGGWKPVFWISAATGFAGAAVIFYALSAFEKKYTAVTGGDPETVLPEGSDAAEEKAESRKEPSPAMRGGTVILFFALLLAVITVQGSLKDGVDTWMPVYISSTFGLGADLSILTGVILPVFAMLSYSVATFVYEKLFRNEMTCCAAFFALSAGCSGVLIFLRGSGQPAEGFAVFVIPALSVLMLASLVGCMHAVNLLTTCFVPRRFKAFGNISWVSGLTNFGSYVGSAVATYLFARITEGLGWTSTVVTWIILSAAGIAICLAGFFPWKKLLGRIPGESDEEKSG